METITIPQDIKALIVEAESFPQGVQAAFEKLGKLIPAGGERTLFGISNGKADGSIAYRAAIEQKSDGEAEQFGLDTFTIRKGSYISETISDFQNNIPAIGSTFRQLLGQPNVDPNGYCLERYKGKDVECMVTLAD